MHSANIYRVNLVQNYNFKDLYYKGSRQALARFPYANDASPFLYKDPYLIAHPNESVGLHYLKDSNMPTPPQGVSYVGATVISREINWSYLPVGVTACDATNKILTLDYHKFSQYLYPYGEWKPYSWG